MAHRVSWLVPAVLAAAGLAWAEPAPPPARAPVVSLGSPHYRHSSAIEYAATAPDGRTWYTLSGGAVHAWDLHTGTARRVFADHRLRNSLRVSPDGKHLLSISQDEVAIWDAGTGKEVKRFPWSLSATAAAYRPDGKAVLMFREGRIEEWPLDKGHRVVGQAALHHPPAFSPDGKWFAAAAAADVPTEVVVYDAQTLEKKSTLATGPAGFGRSPSGLSMVRAGFSPDGKDVATASAAGGLRVWSAATGKVVQEFDRGAGVPGRAGAEFGPILYSADGATIFVGTEAGTVRRWDATSGRELDPFRGHRAEVLVLSLAEGGKHLVSAGRDGIVRRWEVANGREIPPPDGYTGVPSTALSPDGRSALVWDATGRMDVWDVDTGKLRAKLRSAGPSPDRASAVGPMAGFLGDDGRVFATDATGAVTIWAADGKEAGRVQVVPTPPRPPRPGLRVQPAVRDRLLFCVPSPDGRSFVVNRGYKGVARVDAATGPDAWAAADLTPKGIVNPPAFTPDGKTIYLGVVGYDHDPAAALRGKLEIVRLDAATGKVIDRAEPETTSRGDVQWFGQPRFSGDGRVMTIGYGMYEVFVVDPAANKVLHRHNNAALALSPGGGTSFADFLGEVRAHDTTTGKELYRAKLANQSLGPLHVFPDGKRVLAAGGGGVACVWELKPLGRPE